MARASTDDVSTRARQTRSRSRPTRAGLWRDQGKRDAARDLLAPVYGWFTEGFDTLDLKEAKVLLDELPPDNQFRNGLLDTAQHFAALFLN